MQKITHAAIIPLLGGQTIGASKALENNPEYLISFKPFYNNDSQLINYLKYINVNIPYYVLDEKNINNVDDENNLKYVDIVHSVCPCAGLSSLSSTSSPTSATNDWMYICTNVVLSKIKPLIYFGENAPALSSNAGELVAKQLFEIGKKYGYKFSMYRTQSNFHNNPQLRKRTFYFFYKNENNGITR